MSKIKLTIKEFFKIEKEFQNCRIQNKPHPKYNNYMLVKEEWWDPEIRGYRQKHYLQEKS